MSMNGLQHLVCRAAIEADFLHLLARSPADALLGFEISADEAAMIEAARPRSLDDLARAVEAWRRGDLIFARPRVSDAAVPVGAG